MTDTTTATADDTMHPESEAGHAPELQAAAPAEGGHEAVSGGESGDESGGEPEHEAGTGDEGHAGDEDEAGTGFADLGLSVEIQRALAEKGYRAPTPIQAQAIPTVLMGRDVLGCAQTGTGKTAGFVLPMLDILSGSRARARMPRSLILEPTRELALQVAENFVQYGKHLKLTHALLIGGESLSDQKDALMKGVDVLIATPGRLMDLFERGGLLLTDVSLLVIDEADRMLDMGFIPDVEKIVGFLPRTRQTLFFSATMAPEIRRLADAFLQNPKEITVSRPASVATTIVAGICVVDELDKREALRRMLAREPVQNALIFCNRKRDVDILYKSLKRHGFSVGSLHGDMSQPERFATLARFKANELQLLVCSDVAARGIDIGGLSHVFNFDVPIHAEDYVHRIGRTGRAGMTGHAFTLATPDDGAFVAAIEKLVGASIPRFAVDGMGPLELAEGDGRRRGRGRAKTPARAVKDVEALAKPRRGRSPRKPDGEDAAAVDLAAAPQPEVAAPLPRPEGEEKRTRSRGGARGRDRREPRREEARAEEPRRDDARSEEPRREDGRREDGRRDDGRRDEARVETRGDGRGEGRSDGRGEGRSDGRGESRGDRGRRDERPRRDEFVRRDEPRRYRPDDLGPAVMGFGDDVPAFMMLRSRGAAGQEAHAMAEAE